MSDVACVCNPAAASISDAHERRPPPLPAGNSVSLEQEPLVSVLSPTTSDRHWAHPNLYRCFDQQSWKRKELVVLDTGPAPSPFFSRLDDPRVRYTHLPLSSNLQEALDNLQRTFTTAATRSPLCVHRNEDDDARWRAAWASATDALAQATAGREWFELEEEGC